MSDQPVARERLLASVVEHFTTEGLGDQSLRRIAEAVGSSHRMLLYHFGSRDGLLLAVAQEVERRTRIQVEVLSHDATASTDEHIRRVWDYVADPALARFERLFFALYGRALQGDDALRPLLEGDVAGWLDTNVALASAGGVDAPAATVRLHARLGLAVVRGLLLDLLATGEREEVGAALELFARAYTGAWWEDSSRRGSGGSGGRRRHQRARLVAAPMACGHRVGDGGPDLDGAAAVGDGGGVEVESGAVVAGDGAEAPGPVERGDVPVVNAGRRDGAAHVSARSWREAARGCPSHPGRAARG